MTALTSNQNEGRSAARSRRGDFGSGELPVWRDGLGRGLMALAAIAAVGAFVVGLSAVREAGPDRAWVELWRTTGFLVFAGMFALMAARPRASAGVWELAFGHKAAMAAARPFMGDVDEAAASAAVDIVLATVIAVAYVCSRGWRSWQSRPASA